MNDAVVRAKGLAFSFGMRVVLAQLDLDVAAGEIFGVVGADGAGKSTLLRLLIGQLEPSGGTLDVLGCSPHDAQVRSRIAYMPQSFGQYADLTVDENLWFFAELHGLARADARQTIADLLARTGLAAFARRRAGQLSGGMMQKLALACALVSHPQLMFLDEPTTGVDPVSRRAFWRLLEQVRSKGVAIVYATANLDEAERCDRVGLLSDGHFERCGAPLALIRQVSAPLLALTGPGARTQRALVRSLASVALVFPVGESLKVWLREAGDRAGFEAAITQAAPKLAVAALRPTLHDVAMRDLALAHGSAHERSVAQGH